ncbi:cysteine desulfurase [Photobacterium japonica]|uniref:cysteine desulfurase family protein n=1 Tax=Photobacterium japonica TaxID=2910235 RepID=UPI003D0C49D8
MSSYYDYAASTPLSDAVFEEMRPWFGGNFANPSSSHAEGDKATRAIQAAREVIADKIGALPSEIIFTSGASEANNLALKGMAFKRLEKKGHIITSSIEHKCILNTCAFLESIGFSVTYLVPDRDGRILADQVEAVIQDDTFLISIHHVNNELGTIQPIADFGAIAFEHDILFHTDSAQGFCKCEIDVDDMDIDMLSLSGHKIYGPKGIGALYVRDIRNSGLVPQIHGGGQEGGLRGGTSPTPLIVGLSAAVRHFPTEGGDTVIALDKALTEYVFSKNGGPNTVATICSVTFKNDDEVKRFLENNDWLISQGSACNAMSNIASHVLTAIGLSEEEARRTYRISLPPYSHDTD